MNIYLKTLLALFIALAALPLAAHQLPNFLIINAGLGKKFGLKVEGIVESRADFAVKTEKGKVLLQHKITGNDYQGIYSLEYLEEGAYIFILKTSTGEIHQPILLTERAIHYQLTERKLIFSPEVKQKGRQLDIDFENPSRERFSIKLLNSSDDTLYEETIEGLDEVEKRINLLRVPIGTYYLELKTPSALWRHELKLD